MQIIGQLACFIYGLIAQSDHLLCCQQAIMITDHDIKKQEMRVIEARRRLQHAVLSAENGDDDD